VRYENKNLFNFICSLVFCLKNILKLFLKDGIIYAEQVTARYKYLDSAAKSDILPFAL